jgi:hypothetical protein
LWHNKSIPFQRLDNDRWILQEFNQFEATLRLESIEETLPVQQICQNVTWDE